MIRFIRLSMWICLFEIRISRLLVCIDIWGIEFTRLLRITMRIVERLGKWLRMPRI